ncbi:heme o synthase [Leadbetterella sp. DM7]|uniref:heme o synthase n=1 Tax=Leadbetterella sp. DM7 TaxID=3235085 RepID=UPI00349EA13D
MNSTINISAVEKLKAYFELTKFRLSMTVVFSSCFGYALAAQDLNIAYLLVFGLASFLVTASANVINQIKEKDLDRLMSRTHSRPLPSGRLSVQEAAAFSLLCGLAGLAMILILFNLYAALLALLSLLLYGFVYTPLKRVGPIAVAVGALPGAFPPMIGWVASSGHFGLEPGILFAIQFFWQFPHFWAIAWVLDDDYSKAGFKLLPSKGGRDLSSAFQIMSYTLFLLPLCWVPYYLGMTGINSAVIALLSGVLFLAQTLHLMKERTNKAALKLMFGSFLYLPVVQIAYLLDKV